MKRSVRQLLILCLCEFCITISIYAQHGTHQNSSLNEKGNNYFLARTRGSLSYIEYGPGDDRLGGAKMTYLDSGILLKVIDSLGTDYIIALSSTLHAFIQKSSVQKDTQSAYSDHYLSGNWKT